MSLDELAVMDGSKCILQLRGVRPFFSNKYDITKHHHYKLLSDFDSKNAFNIEEYVSKQAKLSNRAKIQDDEQVELFDFGEFDMNKIEEV